MKSVGLSCVVAMLLASSTFVLLGCDDNDQPTDGDADGDMDGDFDGDVHADSDVEAESDADQDEEVIEYIDRTFPEGFLFGTATAGFQVEMGCPTIPAEECEDRNSDWYEYITSKETLESGTTHLAGDPPSYGPGHWELYETDIELAATELHNNAFRISIEWSRIFPTATDDAQTMEDLEALADADAIDHYHDVFTAMRDNGITPLVTLNHYSLPTWIHDAVGCHTNFATCSPRGWVDRERTVREIAKYAGFVAREFGGEVDLWATLNEPFAVLFPGFIFPTEERSNPPAVVFQHDAALTVMVAQIEAHARMYDAVTENDTEDADGDGDPAEVGLVYAMSPVRPMDPTNEEDVTGADNLFYLWTMAFLRGVALGELDDDLDGVSEHREDLDNRIDYVGINYYSRITVEGTDEAQLPDLSPLSTFNLLSMVIWEDYPRGIYDMIMIVNEEFGVPAYITENGYEDPNDDGTGPSWLVRYLAQVHQAIEDGGDVRGYFYWSLMDNYEWNRGMNWRMGLYAVDPEDKTKERVPRSGVAVYGQIAQSRTVTAEMQETYSNP